MRHFLYLSILLTPLSVFAQSYQRASDTSENVKNKLFPKASRFEISAPAAGLILNQSYLDSYLIHAALTYYFNESWGLSLEGAWIKNIDKPERYCIEHFYNDSANQVSVACPETGEDPAAPLENSLGGPIRGANVGPAYVPIRELNSLVFVSAVWNPIYGKQLAFLSLNSYFDIFTSLGIGASFSTFYPESQYLRNGKISRQELPSDFKGVCPTDFGVCPSDIDFEDLIGENGRPDPKNEINPMLTIGLGQKFHFAKRFHIKAEVRNFSLLGGEQKFENYFALWLGLGVRF